MNMQPDDGHIHIPTYLPTYLRTYVHTYMHACITHTYVPRWLMGLFVATNALQILHCDDGHAKTHASAFSPKTKQS